MKFLTLPSTERERKRERERDRQRERERERQREHNWLSPSHLKKTSYKNIYLKNKTELRKNEAKFCFQHFANLFQNNYR